MFHGYTVHECKVYSHLIGGVCGKWLQVTLDYFNVQGAKIKKDSFIAYPSGKL